MLMAKILATFLRILVSKGGRADGGDDSDDDRHCPSLAVGLALQVLQPTPFYLELLAGQPSPWPMDLRAERPPCLKHIGSFVGFACTSCCCLLCP